MRAPLRWLAVSAMLPGIAFATQLCEGHPRSIEPDMQIRESDLATGDAREAVAELRGLLAISERDQVMAFGIANRLQRLTGYTLRQQALEDIARYGAEAHEATTSTRAFCRWLAEDGSWYD